MKRRLVAVALAVPFLLGACGTAAPDSPAADSSAAGPATPAAAVAEVKASDEHNDADVMFLQMLVFHQKQGLEMTSTAIKRAKSPELKTLAEAVQATEKDELELIESWLSGWGRETEVGKAASLHADHGGLPGTGPAEIKSLTTVKAAAFDNAFLNLFLAHQHQAIEMAQLQKKDGANAETKAFAERVVQSRQGEIQQMLKLMNG